MPTLMYANMQALFFCQNVNTTIFIIYAKLTALLLTSLSVLFCQIFYNYTDYIYVKNSSFKCLDLPMISYHFLQLSLCEPYFCQLCISDNLPSSNWGQRPVRVFLLIL